MNALAGYIIDGVTYPSISKVIASDSRNKQAAKSAALNPQKLQAEAMRRGTAIHSALRSFLTTGEAELTADLMPYWSQLYSVIELLDIKPTWSEGPLTTTLPTLKVTVTVRFGLRDGVQVALMSSAQ